MNNTTTNRAVTTPIIIKSEPDDPGTTGKKKIRQITVGECYPRSLSTIEMMQEWEMPMLPTL